MGRYVATGTADGGASISASEKYPNRVVYDSPGTYTFTVPDKVTKIKVATIGGGSEGFEGYKAVEQEDAHWKKLHANTYLCSSDDNVECLVCCNKSLYHASGALNGFGACCCCVPTAGMTKLLHCTCSTNECFRNEICLCGSRNNDTKACMIAFGGGSGGYAHKEIKVLPGDNYNVSVGAAGETSSFGTELSATGAKTIVTRKFSTDSYFKDHASCLATPCHWCRCSNNLHNCLDEYITANTTNPVLVTGSQYNPGASYCCDFIDYYSAMKTRHSFIESVAAVPGEGVGGDVNKTGSAGHLHEYTIDVPSEVNCRLGYIVGYGQCMNSATNSFGAGYFNETACICGFCGFGCIKDTYFCAPSATTGCCSLQCCNGTAPMGFMCQPLEPGLAFNDTKIRGAIAPTENYSASDFDDCVSGISYYAAPYNCQEGYKRKYGLKTITQSTKYNVAGAGLWKQYIFAACTYGGACSSHMYSQDRPLYYVPTCDEGLNKLYYDYVRFKPARELFEMAFCCDDLTYEERMVSEDIHDRLQSNCMCYQLSCMLACSSGNTELNILGEGDEAVLVPNQMVWDNEYRYAMCSGQNRNNYQYFFGDINTSDLVSNGIAQNEEQANKIIDNTRNRYFGNWEKVFTEGTHSWCASCSDGTARPGLSETSGTHDALLSVPYCLRKEYNKARTSSSTTACNNFTNYDGVPNSNNCTLGACGFSCASCAGGSFAEGEQFGCNNGGTCSTMTYPVVSHSRPFTDFRPTLDTSCNICILEKGAMRSGHMSPTANIGCCGTVFFSPKVRYKEQSGSITEECYKECYRSAGQGGSSSWYKECSQGRPGLVVVCY
jgi:hypothetical protein